MDSTKKLTPQQLSIKVAAENLLDILDECISHDISTWTVEDSSASSAVWSLARRAHMIRTHDYEEEYNGQS